MGEKYSGEIIKLESNGKEKIDVCVNGNTLQIGGHGKNLFKVKEDLKPIIFMGSEMMNVSVPEPGIIGLTGKISNSVLPIIDLSFRISETMKDLKAGTYCMSIRNSLGLSLIPIINLYAYNGDESNATLIASSSSAEYSFEISQDYEKYYFDIEFKSGQNFSNYRLMFQLEKGDTATEWEAYSDNPTPDYPSEIKTVTGDIEIDICNKINLIPINVNEFEQGGLMGENGSNVDDAPYYNTRVRTKKYYSISATPHIMYITNENTNVRIGNIHYYDKNKKWITSQVRIDGVTPYKEVVLTPPDGTEFVRVLYLKKDNTLAITTKEVEEAKIVLIEGTEKDYQGQVYPLTLRENTYKKENSQTLDAYVDVSTTSLRPASDSSTILIPCKGNTEYEISHNNSNITIFRTGYLEKEYSSVSPYSPVYGVDTSTDGKHILTTSINAKYIVVQINKGYLEAVKETLKVIDTSKQAIELCKIGDYTDYIYKINNKWFRKTHIKKIVFDGVENKIISKSGSTKNNQFYSMGYADIIKPSDNFVLANIISNHFKQETANNIYSNDIECVGISIERKITFGFGLNSELTTVELANEWLQRQNENGIPVVVYCQLETPTDTEITDTTLIEQLEDLSNNYLYEGLNNITISGEGKPTIEFEILKLVEEYDFYLSEEGYLVIPEYNIKYLVNHQESNIPTMPEAVESSVRAAGRDGDIVLKTSYEPIPFNVVCYTEDNLTADEKKENENKIKTFFNSIKNKTKKFAIESDLKFYDVKYNSLLTAINFPSHMKFSIPFKSSESYGKDVISKKICGNSSKISETVKEVGALITINGPANNPIIALNDYSMEYNMSILDGAKVEIDTNKSTIINVNSDGVKTNVMKYYNHQFPKIQNGNNELKVLSGIDDKNQVTVEWNDLKL